MHKKNIAFLIILTLVILLSVSCEKDDLVITSSVISPYLISEENRMGLSVYVLTKEDDENLKEMRITSPDGTLSWTADIQYAKYQGIKYAGSSNFVMPENTALPKGKWKLSLVSNDGRVCEYDFEVSYEETERTEAGYDELSNLTII